MIQTKIGNHTKLTASEGYIHRLGTDIYATSIIMLPADSIDDYEEVDSIPSMTKADYDARVAALVRERYSESEEFAIQRKAINGDRTEFEQYNAYVEQCKHTSKSNSN